MGGCRLLYFVKSKNGTKCVVLLCFYICQYIHSFVFPEMAGRGGATAPLATPLNPPLPQPLNAFIPTWIHIQVQNLSKLHQSYKSKQDDLQ